MIGDRLRVGEGCAGDSRAERLALLLELRRARAGLHSPARSTWSYHRIRRALLTRAAQAGVRLCIAPRGVAAL